eukprot:EG_transcript_25857
MPWPQGHKCLNPENLMRFLHSSPVVTKQPPKVGVPVVYAVTKQLLWYFGQILVLRNSFMPHQGILDRVLAHNCFSPSIGGMRYWASIWITFACGQVRNIW